MDRSTRLPILAAAAGLAILVAALIFFQRPRPPGFSSRPFDTEEQKAYLREVVISNVRMSSARNFLGDTVVYLDAQLTNRGSKVVRRVECQLEFLDPWKRVVLRERASPVTGGTPPLRPGETRAFRITFEHLPTDWNQAPPAITTTRVNF